MPHFPEETIGPNFGNEDVNERLLDRADSAYFAFSGHELLRLISVNSEMATPMRSGIDGERRNWLSLT